MMKDSWIGLFNVLKMMAAGWMLFRCIAIDFGIIPTPEHVAQTAYLALAFVIMKEVQS